MLLKRRAEPGVDAPGVEEITAGFLLCLYSVPNELSTRTTMWNMYQF